MSDSLTIGPITLTTSGEQTGRFLGTGASTVPGTFASMVRQTNNVDVYIPSSTVAQNAGATLVVPASVNTGSGIVRGDQVAVAAGAGPISDNFVYGALASAATGTFAQSIYGTSNSLIDVWGGSDTVTSLSQNSTVAAGGSDNHILMGATNDMLFVDSGSSTTITETGHPDLSTHNDAVGSANIIVIGSYGAQQPTASAGQTNITLNNGNFVDLIDPTANVVLTETQGANTIIATAGVSTVFAAAGGNIYNGTGGNASLYFVGNPSVTALSTVTGGGGNATLFAANGVAYTEGSGTNIYVGGTGTSTVTGSSGHDILFGGRAGDLYQVGGGNEFYVNGGAVDTISGGSVGPSVYGNNGGTDIMTGTQAGVFAADGSNDVLNAAQAKQGNTFFALNVPGVGNSTLIGSLAAPSGATFDRFAVESVTGGANLPHWITIENFQKGDAVFLEGYSAADNQNFAQAIDTSNPGSSLSVTLSDNTTILFSGQHPTGAFANGTIAI